MMRSHAATDGDPVSAGGCSCSAACRMSIEVWPQKAGHAERQTELDREKRTQVLHAFSNAMKQIREETR